MGDGEKMRYIFNEDKLIEELKQYIDGTYDQHYASKGRVQVTEFIASHCSSPDFFRGNAMKYLARYGHKEGYNRKDLLKALHYIIMMLDWNDKTELNLMAPTPGYDFTKTHNFISEDNTWRTKPKHYGDKK